MLKVKCPHCLDEIRYKDEHADMTISCPCCAKKVHLPKPKTTLEAKQHKVEPGARPSSEAKSKAAATPAPTASSVNDEESLLNTQERWVNYRPVSPIQAEEPTPTEPEVIQAESVPPPTPPKPDASGPRKQGSRFAEAKEKLAQNRQQPQSGSAAPGSGVIASGDSKIDVVGAATRTQPTSSQIPQAKPVAPAAVAQGETVTQIDTGLPLTEEDLLNAGQPMPPYPGYGRRSGGGALMIFGVIGLLFFLSIGAAAGGYYFFANSEAAMPIQAFKLTQANATGENWRALWAGLSQESQSAMAPIVDFANKTYCEKLNSKRHVIFIDDMERFEFACRNYTSLRTQIVLDGEVQGCSIENNVATITFLDPLTKEPSSIVMKKEESGWKWDVFNSEAMKNRVNLMFQPENTVAGS